MSSKAKKQLAALNRVQAVFEDPDKISDFGLLQLQNFSKDIEILLDAFPKESNIGILREFKIEVDKFIQAEIGIRRAVTGAEYELRKLFHKTVKETLREHKKEHEVAHQELCITCNKRPRHFGEYCKRCCPPEMRPIGKVT